MTERPNPKLGDLAVFAQGVYRVQLSSGKKLSESSRVDVHARIDPATGEVHLFVRPEDLHKLD